MYAYVYAYVCYCQRAIFKSPQLASEYDCNLALDHPELNAVLYMEILLCTVSCFLKRLQVSSRLRTRSSISFVSSTKVPATMSVLNLKK